MQERRKGRSLARRNMQKGEKRKEGGRERGE